MWTIRHILVPTDLSDAAGVAIDRAFDLAKKHDAAVTVLNASEASLRGYYPEEFEADRRTIEKLVNAKAPAGIQVKVTQRDGPAAEAILQAADDLGADLIVMGTHGRSGLGRAVLGSVTETVVRSATVPVLTVRATAKKTTAG
jgi:nucleotide-binding universal stress UspA family protein